MKWNFLKVWVLFFTISLMGWSTHTVLQLAGISALWSLVIVVTSVVFIKLKDRFSK